MLKDYKEGTVVLGTVTGIQEYGIFVKLDNVSKGLIHISNVDNKYIKDLLNYVELGELIRVRVIKKMSNSMYSLTIKDVDYRIMKRFGSKIIETPSGFKNLALHLDYWVSKELENIKNQKKL